MNREELVAKMLDAFDKAHEPVYNRRPYNSMAAALDVVVNEVLKPVVRVDAGDGYFFKSEVHRVNSWLSYRRNMYMAQEQETEPEFHRVPVGERVYGANHGDL